MFPVLLSKIGVPVLASILSDAIGKLNHPAAKNAANILQELDAVLAQGQISAAEIEEANRHTETMARIKSQEYAAHIGNIHETLQTEIVSDDKYVRRMRPTFGYLMAVTWAAQMMGVAYVIIFKTAEAHLVLRAVESLSMIWTVGLSVLGIYVYKRSEEKKSVAAPFYKTLLGEAFDRNDRNDAHEKVPEDKRRKRADQAQFNN